MISHARMYVSHGWVNLHKSCLPYIIWMDGSVDDPIACAIDPVFEHNAGQKIPLCQAIGLSPRKALVGDFGGKMSIALKEWAVDLTMLNFFLK